MAKKTITLFVLLAVITFSFLMGYQIGFGKGKEGILDWVTQIQIMERRK